MLKKVFLAGLITMLLLSGTISCGGAGIEKEPIIKPAEEKPVSVPTPTPPVTEESKQPEPDLSVIKISAEKLYSEFQANPLATKLKYKDKILEVTGVISRIDTNPLLGVYVRLIGDRAKAGYTGVEFYFSSKEEREKVASLSKGQTVTIRGNLPDWLVSFVLIRNAQIIK